jgi:NADP+-dependent farnesol dehydrogenase
LKQNLDAGAKGEIHALKCDISKEEEILNAVKWTREKLGGADVLINNAGVLHISPLLSKKIERILVKKS